MAFTFWIELTSGRVLSSHFDAKEQGTEALQKFEQTLEPAATATTQTWHRWIGSDSDDEHFRIDTVIAYGLHEKTDFADVYDRLRRSSYVRGSSFST
jgi:hypothetical protein